MPNGIVGSVYVTSIRHSNTITLNMSVVVDYLYHKFKGIFINGQKPALHTDEIFNVRLTILPYTRSPSFKEKVVSTKMSRLR